MPSERDFIFEMIAERLDELSDRQLTHMIEVIRATQKERQDDALVRMKFYEGQSKAKR